MEQRYHYATVTEAIDELQRQGFTMEFTAEEHCVVCCSEKFHAGEFEIKEIYRYEGDSDPADEAAVYGIQSRTGMKGILVTGYGISTDNFSSTTFNMLAGTKV
ncbi:MAG: hypothetical protein PHP42_01795 [Bacteroidota bacterium]|nr:hypothetical protein [Bacteroidota bacterium]